MTIITKPAGGVLKGLPATFTLNKSQVLALSIVSNNDYFSDSSNWKKIILKYESSEGKQQELVRFDATLASPTGFFLVSEQARDLFEIKSLKIVDFDGDVLVVPRSALVAAEFDIDFGAGVPQPVSVMWLANPAYVLEGDGGATASATRGSYSEYSLTFADPSQYVTDDFTFEAVLSSAYTSNNFIGFYDSTNPTVTTAFTGTSIYFEQAIVASYSIPTSPTYTVKIQRTGLNVKFYVNDVEKYSGTHTNIAYAKVPFFTFTDNAKYIVSASLTLPEAPAAQTVTWDVANKTGIGTVTTGSNGLITRSDAGGGYNLNILSNETITGDGYVEFVIPANFYSVVFGLAEVNSPTGSFNNLIFGGYRVTNPGAMEAVYTTGNLTVYYGTTFPNITANAGDIARFERVGTTYSYKLNGTTLYSMTINNTNPLKASVSPYYQNTSVNNVTISG